LAPGDTTIEFSPSGVTVMYAIPLGSPHQRHVDARRAHRVEQQVRIGVPADRAEEPHPSPQPAGRDGGVRPLATGQHFGIRAEHRLTRARPPVDAHHEIGIGRSQHHDVHEDRRNHMQL
jgi:hypothetical protein